MKSRRYRLGCVSLMVLAGLSFANCSGPDRATSVVIITMDTTRADHLGPYGYDDAQTPTIERLAADGTLYERAYSVTAETPNPVCTAGFSLAVRFLPASPWSVKPASGP